MESKSNVVSPKSNYLPKHQNSDMWQNSPKKSSLLENFKDLDQADIEALKSECVKTITDEVYNSMKNSLSQNYYTKAPYSPSNSSIFQSFRSSQNPISFHEEKKPMFQCYICKTIFEENSYRKKEIAGVFNGKQRFQCNNCWGRAQIFISHTQAPTPEPTPTPAPEPLVQPVPDRLRFCDIRRQGD